MILILKQNFMKTKKIWSRKVSPYERLCKTTSILKKTISLRGISNMGHEL